MTQLVIRIAARRDGFRRAGLAHPKAPIDHSIFAFTAAQLGVLQAEPQLSVRFLDLGRPEIPGQPTFEALIAEIEAAIAKERAAEEAAAEVTARAEQEAADAQAAAEAAALKAQEEAEAEATARRFTPPEPPAGATDTRGEEADGKTTGGGDPAAAGGGADATAAETAPAAKRGKKAEAKT